VVPAAAGGSLPMLPTEALGALTKMKELYDTYNHQIWGNYGFTDSFKLGHALSDAPSPIAEFYCGLDVGIMLIMAENYNSGLVWNNFSGLEIESGVTMADRIIERLGLTTDKTCKIAVDEISTTSNFHMGVIEPANPTYTVQFDLTTLLSKPYLLAIHSFMDKSLGDHSVIASVKVNDGAPFNVTFNYSSAGDAQDLMKYVEITNLKVGTNTTTIQWQSGTDGAKWLAWKNVEVSSPSDHDTWLLARDESPKNLVLFGSEYRVDATYYAGADVSSFAQGVNKDVRNFSDILFYTENTEYGAVTLKALETQNGLATNVQVFVNGSPTPVFNDHAGILFK
jgi:hypothetical protein